MEAQHTNQHHHNGWLSSLSNINENKNGDNYNKQRLDQQLNCIKSLLLEITNDSKWNNLKNELINYEIYLKQQQQQQLITMRSGKGTNSSRPTKPPLRLNKKSIIITTRNGGGGAGHGDNHNHNHNDNDNNRNNKIFPTKPPMRLKQSQQLNKNNNNNNNNNNHPLLRLFIRFPPNNISMFKMETREIVIWNHDNNEIEQIVNRFCDGNNQSKQYKNDIKNTILELIKS